MTINDVLNFIEERLELYANQDNTQAVQIAHELRSILAEIKTRQKIKPTFDELRDKFLGG